MRDEYQRNLNLLRGILHACEEGATEELCDGSDGDGPWTEEDRRKSRETADWIRATFFAPEPNKGAKLKRKRLLASETYFSEEKLWDALDHADACVRASAIDAFQALADLAAVRARRWRSNFLAERRDVFETKRVLEDMHSDDRELHEAAHLAFFEASALEAHIESLTMPIREEDRQWAREVVASIRDRIDEMRHSADAAQEPQS